MTIKRRATGLMTTKERAALENVLIGPRVLRAAFLYDDPICAEWAARRSQDLADATNQEEAGEIIRAIAKERVAQLARLDAIDMDSPKELARVEAREASLSAQARTKAGLGMPALFDRRSGEWTTESHWTPVAGVDAPGGQVFHATIN